MTFIQTIRGPIRPEELGVTYSHDHLFFRPPSPIAEQDPDLVLDSVDAAIQELTYFRMAGGQALVEMTTVELGRNSHAMRIISKATGVPLAKVATKVMLGNTLKSMGLGGEARIRHVAVKSSVFPFLKLPGVDSILGPEMKSTGEVMGIDSTFPAAMWRGVLPSLSLALTSAPAATSNSAIALCPASDALCSGVHRYS